MRWTVLIPAKALPAAKSRLVAASVDAAAHARLVRAIRADTLAAALGVPDVARVLVVTDRPEQVGDDDPRRSVLVQYEPGLNAAVREGGEHARATWPNDAVAALVGDLPALRSSDLAAALRRAADHSRAYVADAEATGTTLLTALPGVDLQPAFGAGSAARHGVDGTALDAAASVRRDVDTAADLTAALVLGVGARTRAALGAAHPGCVSPEAADADPGRGEDTVRSTAHGMMTAMRTADEPEGGS